jgi:hypothetical protein
MSCCASLEYGDCGIFAKAAGQRAVVMLGKSVATWREGSRTDIYHPPREG